jgi:hypothetical protein
MRFLCACLVLGAAVLCPQCLCAQELLYGVTGVVKKLDAKIGTITVRPNGKGVIEDQTFSLLKSDIDVTGPSGEKMRLDGIAPGQTVQLKIGVGEDVAAIVVQASVFPVTVVDIDLQSRTMTLAGHPNGLTAMTVAPDASITLARRSAY